MDSLGRMSRRAIALLLALAPLLAPLGVADDARLASVRLPDAVRGAAATTGGDEILVFGGAFRGPDLRRSDAILRYHVPTATITTATSRLPEPANSQTSVWDGRYAYVFGGIGNGAHPDFNYRTLHSVVRYDPVADTVQLMSAKVAGGAEKSAVWTGSHAYIIGGLGRPGCTLIERYDPGEDEVSRPEACLPEAFAYGPAAAWDGRFVYVLGGYCCGTYARTVYRYDPSLDRAEAMEAELPLNLRGAAAVWDGHNVFVFEGRLKDRILKYDPEDDAVVEMAARLPTNLSWAPAVWHGRHAYLLGGSGPNGTTDAIVRYHLAPAAPTNLTATIGLLGTVHLDWQAPASNTYSTLTNYRIYRGLGDEELELLAEAPNATHYVDDSCPLLTTCSYRVAGVNAGLDEGPPSNMDSALGTAVAGQLEPGAPPPVPGDL